MTNEINPIYETVETTLPHGLKFEDGTMINTATIREQIVADMLILADSDESAEVQILAARIVKLGIIENPGLTILKQLSPFDMAALREAAIAQDNAIESRIKGTEKKT